MIIWDQNKHTYLIFNSPIIHANKKTIEHSCDWDPVNYRLFYSAPRSHRLGKYLIRNISRELFSSNCAYAQIGRNLPNSSARPLLTAGPVPTSHPRHFLAQFIPPMIHIFFYACEHRVKCQQYGCIHCSNLTTPLILLPPALLDVWRSMASSVAHDFQVVRISWFIR